MCDLQQGSHCHNSGKGNFPYQILGRLTTTFFVGWRIGCLEDEPRPVLVSAHPQTKIVKIYPALKLKLLNMCRQVGIRKIIGTPIFYFYFFILSLVLGLQEVKAYRWPPSWNVLLQPAAGSCIFCWRGMAPYRTL